ncbi:hypothetical protein FGH87_18430 [Salmonella enterica]|uniref:Uncharacterized protein n=2 Tax=Salmonella enterica TaxID=28901 RepID=A0A5W2M307_SALET|nr:hypothetical protein [Salmonella enterica subsp. enterica serovar Ealing]EAB7819383.1 hypothetical protein [Salmonella enterica subsp. enterica]EAB8009911.1 hypothetical protein [Salmonella enterica subsp. enterica serovar Muenchen]EAM1511071.1 hypothetical protein [Salmonella enterica]EBG8047102.1 hypothetical protein [Salmonella enterica subsp. enterica serovar Oranienburg]EBS5059136.1 hypothetical protein [Salmonella enterica subsp. enterica serovar Anecho]EBS5150182.1 hypothetical prot
MTDFNAFSEWLWSCDPGLVVRVQDWHAQWRAMLAHHNRYNQLRAYGNAIVAPVAEAFIKAYMEATE